MSTVSHATEQAIRNQNTSNGGFAGVSRFFARDTDHSSTVFRRFDRLALRNLLYLQARLASLEEQQAKFDEEDLRNGDLTSKEAATSWQDFERLASPTTGRTREQERMKNAIEIQQAVKEYHEALVLHGQILSLRHPPETTLSAFKRFFNPEKGVKRLRKESSGILDNENDLVTLHTSSSPDRMTSFVLNHMGWALARQSEGTAFVQAKTLTRFVTFVSTIMAATLLVGAVATLKYAGSDLHMPILAIYTAAFAATVTFLTSASRAEVFSASCAYVAVLVVFIGTSGG